MMEILGDVNWAKDYMEVLGRMVVDVDNCFDWNWD